MRRKIADRFELLERAGVGGMGSVYRAVDQRDGRIVAVKLLHTLSSPEIVTRFEREARLLAELRHPHIAEWVAHGRTDEGEPYLAMAWLAGRPLSERLARGALSLQETFSLLERIGSALGHAHARGVVHRDVKPENLFLVNDDVDQVRLLDFGIAHAGTVMTRHGEFLGTPGYVAPEQVRGETVDPRTDLFSFGCVLYHCLTGRPPFMADDPVAALFKIVVEEVPPPSELRALVPSGLDELVVSLLAKDPARRPADGGALLGLLSNIEPQSSRASKPAATITESERAIVTAVLAATPRDAQLTALAAAAAASGARVEALKNGTLLVLFEPQGGTGEHAARAAMSALTLAAHGAPRVALATGRATTQNKLPVGEAIDAVAALFAATPPAEIRTDELTRALLDARFELAPCERGYRLLGVRSEAATMRTLLGRPTPFVGRALELGTLEAVVHAALDESTARVALVVAPAGSGKSRLRHELLLRLQQSRPELTVWRGEAEVMSAGAPLGLVAQAIRRAAGIERGDAVEERSAKLSAFARASVAETGADEVADFASELLGLTPEPSERVRAARRDPVVLGDRIRAAIHRLFAEKTAAQPLLLLLDDLHWGDLASVNFVDSLLRRLADRPLAILAFARPEVDELFPNLWHERNPTRIALGKLPERAGRELARAVLGAEAADAQLASLVSRADGNPFFLEELIRVAAEGRSSELPESVVAVLAGRLAGLTPEERRILRAASIFGETFEATGIAHLLGANADSVDLQLSLSSLRQSEILIHGEPRGGQTAFRFRHALWREAAHGMLTDDDRRTGHRLAAEWLEREGNADPLELAEHFEKGGARARAAAWYVPATEDALTQNDLEAAIERAERGSSTAEASEEIRGSCRALAAEACFWLGRSRDSLHYAFEAVMLLERGSPRWCQAMKRVIGASWVLGHADWGEAAVAALSAIEPSADAAPDWTAAMAIAGFRFINGGRRAEGDALVARAESVATHTPAPDPAAMAHLHQVIATQALFDGDFARYAEQNAEAATFCTAAGDMRRLANIRASLGYAFTLLGLYADAERELHAVVELATTIGLPTVLSLAHNNLGLTLACQGRFAEAGEHELTALTLTRAQGDRRMMASAHIYLARILLGLSQSEAAAAEARKGVELTSDAGPMRVVALAILARIELVRGEVDAAVAHSTEAVEIVAAEGVEEGEVALRLVHAEALFARGRREEAKQALTLAREAVERSASRISRPEWRRSFLSNVEENARTLELCQSWFATE